jgi:uncharacterized protein YpmB
MNKARILFIIELFIVLLLAISLFLQVEFGKYKAIKNANSIMGAYNQIELKEFEPSEVFVNVNEQIYIIGGNEQDLLVKSKKEKLMVTTNE